MPLLADTHAHLDLEDYDADRSDVIVRARAAGVSFIINVGFNLETSRAAIDLAERYDFIYASVGIHPHEAASVDERTLSRIESMAGHERVVAIGETGLDYYRDHSPRDAQRAAFREHIRLARRLELPLIIHNRDALDDVLEIVDDECAGEVGGVMHCFPGDAAYAEQVVRRGFHVGIGGPVTFSSGGRLAKVAETVPRRTLLLETDAPWLTPKPHRGKRNEPAYVAFVAERVAELRDMSVADLARAATGNAMRLFRIPERPPPSITYEMWGNLYLNITNRCSNACRFCVRYQSDILWGYNLRLEREPTVDEVLGEVGDPTKYNEIVFCGYGEPTMRLDALLEIAAALKKKGARVRINTNGHGSMIWNRNIAPELAEVVDAVSVSLNASDAETYNEICRPRRGKETFGHVVSFIRECVRAGLDVTASLVDVPGVDVDEVRSIANELGVPLRVRGGGVGLMSPRGRNTA
ncbi:MAG: YchF/TatD family DNA exonuclease [Candidatus Eisenbacteria bacterium]|nr:YchF/TatD family DNA exonuclease [Candidatus Eisenbacteria bacterium]